LTDRLVTGMSSCWIEEQRVALTRSPVMKPKVLMANEPTGDLDSRKAEKSGFDLIARLHGRDIPNAFSEGINK
jgi:predicted ABC-type transport system involved in lysophospholipase L1 biosynthesis ATPase subunit